MKDNRRKIYLSGRITGNENYKKEFEEAEREVMKFFDVEKDDVINPARLDESFPESSHGEYMRRDIKLMMDCSFLIDIENGSDVSKGAYIERIIAMATGMKIISLSAITDTKIIEEQEV